MKKMENRLTIAEECVDLPELDDMLIEGKPIETKEVLHLVKSIQKDMSQKFVSDSKLMQTTAQLQEMNQKISDI
jgi:hypothetical protein